MTDTTDSAVPLTVAGFIDRYQPDVLQRPDVATIWPQIRGHVLPIVTATDPDSVLQASGRLAALSGFATWVVEQHLWDPTAGETLPLSHPLVDHYIKHREQQGFQAGATVRSKLRLMGRTYAPHLWPLPNRLQTRHARLPPYLTVEQETMWEAACDHWRLSNNPTVAAVIAVAFGAGFDGTDFRHVTVEHVHVNSGHATVQSVAPSRPRTVPVADRWNERVIDATCAVGHGPLVGPSDATSKNLMSVVTNRAARVGIPRPNITRMRTTWLVDRLNAGTPVDIIMRYAGFRSISTLDQLIQFVAPRDPDDELPRLRQDPA